MGRCVFSIESSILWSRPTYIFLVSRTSRSNLIFLMVKSASMDENVISRQNTCFWSRRNYIFHVPRMTRSKLRVRTVKSASMGQRVIYQQHYLLWSRCSTISHVSRTSWSNVRYRIVKSVLMFIKVFLDKYSCFDLAVPQFSTFLTSRLILRLAWSNRRLWAKRYLLFKVAYLDLVVSTR